MVPVDSADMWVRREKGGPLMIVVEIVVVVLERHCVREENEVSAGVMLDQVEQQLIYIRKLCWTEAAVARAKTDDKGEMLKGG